MLHEYNGLFNRIDTENTKLPKLDLSPLANDMEADKPIQVRGCLKEGIVEKPLVK